MKRQERVKKEINFINNLSLLQKRQPCNLRSGEKKRQKPENTQNAHRGAPELTIWKSLVQKRGRENQEIPRGGTINCEERFA